MTDNILKDLIASADKPTGTYVGVKCRPFNDNVKRVLKSMGDLEGNKVGSAKLHATVIYSHQPVADELAKSTFSMIKTPFTAKVIGAAAFDALPSADGTRDANVSTIVLKLESDTLQAVHKALKDLGATHTYPELSPHVSLWYGVPADMAQAAVDKLNKALETEEAPLEVELTDFEARPIVDNWSAANTKKR